MRTNKLQSWANPFNISRTDLEFLGQFPKFLEGSGY